MLLQHGRCTVDAAAASGGRVRAVQVLGHTKTICVLLGGAFFFNEIITARIACGMALAVAGMVGYGYFTNREKALAALAQAAATANDKNDAASVRLLAAESNGDGAAGDKNGSESSAPPCARMHAPPMPPAWPPCACLCTLPPALALHWLPHLCVASRNPLPPGPAQLLRPQQDEALCNVTQPRVHAGWSQGYTKTHHKS
jgi:hypothetical protein